MFKKKAGSSRSHPAHLKITRVSICRVTEHYMSYKALYDIYMFYDTILRCYVV